MKNPGEDAALTRLSDVDRKELDADGNVRRTEDGIDTTRTPLRTQYGATLGKAGKGKRLRYRVFAKPCKPLQHFDYHS